MKNNLIKKIWKALSITVIFVSMASMSSGETYDFILKNSDLKKQLDSYNSTAKNSRMIMSYLNLIVDSPQTLIRILERDRCEKDILNFARKNAELVHAMVNISFVITLGELKVSDTEIMYVTGVIEDPKAQAARNGVEYQIEKEVMRQQFPAYALYEKFTERGAIKELLEGMFHGMKDKQNKKIK